MKKILLIVCILGFGFAGIVFVDLNGFDDSQYWDKVMFEHGQAYVDKMQMLNLFIPLVVFLFFAYAFMELSKRTK